MARALLDDGIATVDGEHVQARELPVAPKFKGRPRLLLGGGSDRLLEIAGRHADQVDLNGSSRRRPLGRAQPAFDDHARRRSTTVDDLVDAAERVRAIADASGRPHPALSVVLDALTVGEEPDPSLSECPYVLGGEPRSIATVVDQRVRRIGLTSMILPEGADLESIVPALRELSG